MVDQMITLEQKQFGELWFYQVDTGQHYLSIRYEASNALMYVYWHGSVSVDEVIHSYIQFGHYTRDNQLAVHGSLVDLTKLRMGFTAHNEWMVKHYWPKAMQHGYRRTAIVKANHFPANISLRMLDLLNQLHLPEHEIQLFDQFQQAENWLLDQKEPTI
jgi:hypothetical protein